MAQHTYIQYPNGHREVISSPRAMPSPPQQNIQSMVVSTMQAMMASQARPQVVYMQPPPPQTVYIQPPAPQPVYVQQAPVYVQAPPVAHLQPQQYTLPPAPQQPAVGAYNARQHYAQQESHYSDDDGKSDYVRECMGYGYSRGKCNAIWNGQSQQPIQPPQPRVPQSTQPTMPNVTVIQSEPVGESHVQELMIQGSEDSELMDVDNEEYKQRREQVLKRPDAVVQRFTLR